MGGSGFVCVRKKHTGNYARAPLQRVFDTTCSKAYEARRALAKSTSTTVSVALHSSLYHHGFSRERSTETQRPRCVCVRDAAPRDDSSSVTLWRRGGRCVSIRAADAQELPLSLQVKRNAHSKSIQYCCTARIAGLSVCAVLLLLFLSVLRPAAVLLQFLNLNTHIFIAPPSSVGGKRLHIGH